MGRVLDALHQAGLDDDTVVVVVSDNGGTNKEIDNNLPFYGSKVTLYEGGLRTPLIIRWPGKVEPGRVVDDVVNYLDYYPTFAAVAQIEPPPEVQGANIFDILNNDKIKKKNWEKIYRSFSYEIMNFDKNNLKKKKIIKNILKK